MGKKTDGLNVQCSQCWNFFKESRLAPANGNTLTFVYRCSSRFKQEGGSTFYVPIYAETLHILGGENETENKWHRKKVNENDDNNNNSNRMKKRYRELSWNSWLFFMVMMMVIVYERMCMCSIYALIPYFICFSALVN